MFPKPKFKRRVPTRKKRGEFSKETKLELMEYYEGRCLQCGGQAQEIHHCKFKSQGGRGVFSNGMPVCRKCNAMIHADADLKLEWQKHFESMFGSDYYKDKWDKE